MKGTLLQRSCLTFIYVRPSFLPLSALGGGVVGGCTPSLGGEFLLSLSNVKNCIEECLGSFVLDGLNCDVVVFVLASIVKQPLPSPMFILTAVKPEEVK